MSLTLIEQQVSNVFLSIFGDPIFIGIAFLLVIFGVIAFARLGMSVGLVLLIPTLFIVIAFIPALKIIGGIALGVIFAIGLLRFISSG